MSSRQNMWIKLFGVILLFNLISVNFAKEEFYEDDELNVEDWDDDTDPYNGFNEIDNDSENLYAKNSKDNKKLSRCGRDTNMEEFESGDDENVDGELEYINDENDEDEDEEIELSISEEESEDVVENKRLSKESGKQQKKRSVGSEATQKKKSYKKVTKIDKYSERQKSNEKNRKSAKASKKQKLKNEMKNSCVEDKTSDLKNKKNKEKHNDNKYSKPPKKNKKSDSTQNLKDKKTKKGGKTSKQYSEKKWKNEL